jgi:hypothetical protein
VNRLNGVGIGCGDPDDRARGRFAVFITNLVAELGHLRRAGRRRVVNKHGNVEVASGEALYDMREMHANLVAGGGVFGIVGGDVDGAAGFIQQEMVSGGLVGEAHSMVAAGGNAVVVRRSVLGGGRRSLLGRLGDAKRNDENYVDHGRLDALPRGLASSDGFIAPPDLGGGTVSSRTDEA